MKKKLHISFIALATLMMLGLTIVPHHHHNGVARMIMECCERGDSVNDEPAGHDNDMDHGKSCVTESDFVISQAGNGVRCKVSSCDNADHIHFFPILYLVADFLPYPAEIISPQPEYGEYASFYTSAEASQFHGLRAPPYMLS